MTSQVVLDEISELNLEGFELNNLSFDFLDNEAESEIGASSLTLNDVLDIAFQRCNDYHTQKELDAQLAADLLPVSFGLQVAPDHPTPWPEFLALPEE